MALIRGGNSTAGTANVDAYYNLNVNLPTTKSQAGYARIVGTDNDPLKITAMGYPTMSIESLDFLDTIDGSVVNTNLWNQSVSTMTITNANGFYNLNPTASVAANTYAILSTIPTFFLTSCLPLHVHFSIQASLFNLPANTVFEIMWGTCATNATPTDGMIFRVRAGYAYLVINFGGSETETQICPTPFALPNPNQTYECVLDFYASKVRLYVDGTLYGDVNAPNTFAAATSSNRQPVTLRVYNTASVPSSSATLKLGQMSVQQRNANFDKPWYAKMAGMARGCYQSPVTTFAQTANHANSTSPASATLSNTAAGYTTLGGRYQFAAPATAATDFALFGFPNPAGFQFYCTGVAISAINTGAAVATTATILDWSVAVNSSGVSLATVDGAGTWAPRRIPLGVMGFPLAAPRGPTQIGDKADDIVIDFLSPLVVDSARYFHVIVQVPLGTATGSQIIRGDVMVNGYFE